MPLASGLTWPHGRVFSYCFANSAKMDSNEFKAAWERHKEAFRLQHPQVSIEDLAYEIGKEGELLERLKAKSGKTEEEIRDWLSILG